MINENIRIVSDTIVSSEGEIIIHLTSNDDLTLKELSDVLALTNKAINDLTFGDFPISRCNKLYNADSLTLYEPDQLLINTDIRNGTKLLLFSK